MKTRMLYYGALVVGAIAASFGALGIDGMSADAENPKQEVPALGAQGDRARINGLVYVELNSDGRVATFGFAKGYTARMDLGEVMDDTSVVDVGGDDLQDSTILTCQCGLPFQTCVVWLEVEPDGSTSLHCGGGSCEDDSCGWHEETTSHTGIP
jgi:hypothetical protein